MDRTHKNHSQTFDIPQLVVIGLLIAGAYMLGSLKTKVDYLEKMQGTQAVAAQPQVPAQPQAAAPQPAAPLEAKDVPKPAKDDHVRGNRSAPIALIEYSDLECPFCKSFHPTAKQLVDEYKGQVMWVYRHYPLSFHANAQKESEAAECAAEQGGNDAFWKFIDAIYERTTSNGTGFALDKLGPLAKEIGLDETAFQSCLDDGKYTQKIKDEEDQGTQAGVTGTPGNILLNIKTGKTRLIPGAVPLDQVKSAVDDLLK